jgi:hypothetical protein
LIAEDGVKDVMGLDIMLDSVEPLSIVVLDLNKFLPTFKMESPQEFAIAPIVC